MKARLAAIVAMDIMSTLKSNPRLFQTRVNRERNYGGVATKPASFYPWLCGKKGIPFLAIWSHGLCQSDSCVKLVSIKTFRLLRSTDLAWFACSMQACCFHFIALSSSNNIVLAKDRKHVILHFLDNKIRYLETVFRCSDLLFST